MPQPPMVCIIEWASMDPYAGTDETTVSVGGVSMRVLLAHTLHTVTLRVVEHADSKTAYLYMDWSRYRPAMRDGTAIYTWHEGLKARCMVHPYRRIEDPAMDAGFDTIEYERYIMFRGHYHKTKEMAAEITEMAGGPITSASQLGIICKDPILCKKAEAAIAELQEEARQISDMIDDSAARYLRNAIPYTYNSLLIPGMPIHNNGVERGVCTDTTPFKHFNRLPDQKAAYNHSVLRSYYATCKKNNISVCDATILSSIDPRWSIFTSGIPPPPSSAGDASGAGRAASAAPIQ